jgi:hypothetical protein
MKKFLLVLSIVGCHAKAHKPHLAATNPGFAQPVNIVDTQNQGANILGNADHPMFVSSAGVDGGGGTTLVTNDAGNPVPSDTVPGDQLNTVVHFIVATGAGSVPDAGVFIGANVCNEGASTAWWQIFFGQTTIDAGGTADAGTSPSVIPVRIPSGSCANLNETQTITGGAAVWYSSSTQGLLTVDAGVSNMSVDLVRR